MYDVVVVGAGLGGPMPAAKLTGAGRRVVVLEKKAQPGGTSYLFAIDVDRDGLTDFVTGKRFWARGKDGPDPESNEPAVLYWFKLVRPAKGRADFVPNLVDSNSGVGTQVTAGYVSNKKWPDIVVGNKKGVFVFKHEVR